MKKWISLLCVCMLIFGTFTASIVSASADVEKKENAVDVKKGDEVTYIFSLDKASEPVVGTDFSFYYDSSVFSLDSVADYNDNTDPDEWIAVINPDLDGEVRGVWSILKGVDFSSKRHFITLNLKAKDDADNTHITYRIRFLYGNKAFDAENPKPYLDSYEFTSDILVNGEKVIEKAAPEWNDTDPVENGKFVPSYDGTSENADTSIPGVEDQANKSGSNAKAQNADNNAANNTPANNGSNNGGASNGGGNNAANGGSVQDNAAAAANSNKSDSSATTAPAATTADGYFILATDADGNVTATSDQAPVVAGTDDKKGGSPILWIIIALVVIAGGGAAVYFFMKKKPADNAAAAAVAAGAENAPADAPEAVTPDAEAPEAAEAEAPKEENTPSADDSTES